MQNSLKTHTKLKSYNINPIAIKYISKIYGGFDSISIAKALFIPRVLGPSITTSLGARSQSMLVKLNLAQGSTTSGMDIEFDDKIDNRRKYCQLKAGPNTINKGDVDPLIKEFSKVIYLARTNNMQLSNNDLVLGVLYGKKSQLSSHYREIDKQYPVIVGQEFWHRITGFESFYERLTQNIDSMIMSLETEDFIREGYERLSKEIEDSGIFDF